MGSSFVDLSDSGSLGDMYSYDASSLGSAGVSAPMSTSPVDLSSMQTISFGNGVTGYYDPGSNTYYDSGFNALSPSDLSQYGAFTVTSSASTPAPPAAGGSPPPVTGAGSGATLAGITGMFSSLGNAIANATRPPTVQTPQGTLVYNPATGGYTTTAALTASSALSPLILLLLGGVLLWVILKEA